MSTASTIDLIAVGIVVVAAVLFLGSRFIDRRRPGGAAGGTVVVGAGLQRGLDRARRSRR